MNYKFVEKAHMMTTSDEYTLTYDRIKDCTKNSVGNPYRQEYLANKEAELDKFNGKVGQDDSENKS